MRWLFFSVCGRDRVCGRARPVVGLVALVGVLVACNGSGSLSLAGNAPGCRPAAGDQLVVLADDKRLQTADNIIPAVNAKAATSSLIQALDKVSSVLTMEKLVELNRETDLDRRTSADAASSFVTRENLATGLSRGSGKVVVGAANLSEHQTLASIYHTVLQAAGFDASVQTIGSRELYGPALEKGEIQVVPEYAGTFTEFLNKKLNGPDAPPMASGDLSATVQALTELGGKSGLKFGKPAAAADQSAFAVTKAFADTNGLEKLSDVASKCNGGVLQLGGPAECTEQPFCQPGLENAYGIQFTGFETLDQGGPLTKTAVKTGKVHMGMVFSSDASLAVLADVR